MLYNFIAFTIIFTIFSIIIYNQVKTSIYSNTNKELLSYKELNNVRFVRGPNSEENIGMEIERGEPINFMQIREVGEPKVSDQTFIAMRQNGASLDIVEPQNPRIIFIMRNGTGEIVNTLSIGRFYDDYLKNVGFNPNNLDKIYNLKINNQYSYKGITYETANQDGEVKYAQLLINTDAEENVLKNLFEILIIGTSITVILSIIASYIVSKKSLEPVVKSWKKQRDFVQNASHELRTPLTIIQAKQEMLLKSPEDKILDKSEEISLTLKEAKRLSKLTKDLNVLARADSAEEQINKEIINLDKLIEEISKPYIEFANMQQKKMIMKLEFNKEILVDKERIHQLIVILLDNAIKYTEPNDEIEICTYNKDNKCVIDIKDTGIGVSDEGLIQMFDRFYREDKARTRESGGMGLGLSIAKWIVDIHKGTIKALHNDKKGTIINIRLPIK